MGRSCQGGEVTTDGEPVPSMFGEQSQKWLADLAHRKRKPVSPATLHAFGSYVRRLMLMIGDMPLAEINNGVLRELAQRLDAEGLSPKTINELIATVKQVVGSLVDPNTGEPILQRSWSARFIDAPTILNQKQYCAARSDIERCIEGAASDQERLLYCVLAGSGLRIAEALAIRVHGGKGQTSWGREDQAIKVRSSLYEGEEIPRLKTLAAKRTVDLDSRLNDLIARYVEHNRIQRGDFLFQVRGGRPMHANTARNRLATHGVPGFHAFRRFRITRLREIGVPEDILRYWVGRRQWNHRPIFKVG